jgi:integrase
MSATPPDETQTALAAHRAMQVERRLKTKNWHDRNLIFPNTTGGLVRDGTVNVIWHRTCKRLELPQLRMHDLRHTAATLLLQAGIHPKVVQEMLGHSSITITLDRYSHVIPAMHRQAANTMDDLLGGLPSPQKEPITQEITQVSKKS